MDNPPLLASLRTRLEGCRRLAVLAVGSTQRGDDAAGVLAGQELQHRLQSSHRGPEVEVFLGEAVPENLTGAIRRFAPTHVLVLDAADMGLPAGGATIVDLEQADGNLSASTHGLPMSVLAAYLEESVGCKVVAVGIQPAAGSAEGLRLSLRRGPHRGPLDYRAVPSPQVRHAAKELAGLIIAALDSLASERA